MSTPQQPQQEQQQQQQDIIQHSHSTGHEPSTHGGLSPSSAAGAPAVVAGSSSVATGSSSNTAPLPHIRIVPHLDAPRSLHFEVVDKDVPEGFVLKIGRFTDRQSLPNRVTFKSKVVSRGHAEIFTEQGKFYIRDTKSSSGTFLNHARLSPPGVESKPTQLKDGDVVQLGVDYQGGTQEIYRCVKMRLELNRSWQQQANAFRMNTLKVIRNLTTANAASSTDCCICLFRIASFQSLFVAPCSHVYHYKCIRPLLMATHPGFLCPLCRTFADLEDSVEIDDPLEEGTPAEDVNAAIESSVRDQGAPLEQVSGEPSVQADLPLAEVLNEDSYAPTPPSEQAHTFQPPQTGPYPADADAVFQVIQAQQELNAGQSSHREEETTVGQTAIFMAPSPPASAQNEAAALSASNGLPQQQSYQSQYGSATSPSSHAVSAGNLIQNFVRNISTPTRNRTRTISNSPLNSVVNQRNATEAAAEYSVIEDEQESELALPSLSSQSPQPGHLQRPGSQGDVFGKTLVAVPSQLNIQREGEVSGSIVATDGRDVESLSTLNGRPAEIREGYDSVHNNVPIDEAQLTESGHEPSPTGRIMQEPVRQDLPLHPGDTGHYFQQQQQQGQIRDQE
ncbi:hypothetical protein BGZ98_004898 [Dissophora globulifera]|nr:hypothetical protein BGZ98_004898 [Dissophora globulifera]